MFDLVLILSLFCQAEPEERCGNDEIQIVQNTSPRMVPPLSSLEKAAALAAKTNKPLIIWVNYDAPLVRAVMVDCVHVNVESWKTSAEPGAVACVIHKGWPHGRILIPESEITLDRLRTEMKDLVKELIPVYDPPLRLYSPVFRSSGGC